MTLINSDIRSIKVHYSLTIITYFSKTFDQDKLGNSASISRTNSPPSLKALAVT